MLCCCCRSSVPALLTIHFEHDGFSFSILNTFNSDLLCVNCAIKKHIEKFEKYGRDIISKKNDETQIKWDIYYYGKREETFARTSILLSLGILSNDPRGNWILLEEGCPRTPNHGHKRCYFTKKKDAIEYHRALYGKTIKREMWNINEIHSL